MPKNRFFQTVDERWATGKRICIGLDPDWNKIPEKLRMSKRSSSPQFELNEKIVSATQDLVLCYKINPAYYTVPEGYAIIRNTIALIRNLDKDIPIIYDGKFGDGIAQSNEPWAELVFEKLGCDAVTVHHMPGKQAMLPFLQYCGKGIFVLCRTSGDGSDEFQDIIVDVPQGLLPMYMHVALQVQHHWNYNGNCGLVMGATYPIDILEVRKKVKEMPFLIPGLGSQEGDVHDAVRTGITKKRCGIIPNSSSGIMFSTDPKMAVQKLTDEIDAALEAASK